MQVSPTGGGTTNPAAGMTYPETLDSVVAVTATPNPGYGFINWMGAADPNSASTFVTMDQPQTLTANFAACTISLNGRGTASSSYSPARVGLVWTGIGGVDHYDVMRGAVSGGPYAKVGSAAGTATSFSDTNGLHDGFTYFYILNAVAANGNPMCMSNQKGIFVP